MSGVEAVTQYRVELVLDHRGYHFEQDQHVVELGVLEEDQHVVELEVEVEQHGQGLARVEVGKCSLELKI